MTLAAAGLAASTSGVARAENAAVERYVAAALAKNVGLAASRQEVVKAEAAIAEARGAFLPTLSLEARYSVVSGNALDLGQLVNPVYATLNQLTGQRAFPTDLDLRLPLAQETKLRLVQPLFALEILRAYQLRQHLGAVERAKVDVASRQLAAGVRSAYLRWAKVSRVVELYGEALQVLDESLRVTETLVANGKAVEDAVFRVRAERAELEQRRAEAVRDQGLAARWLNYLAGQPLDAEVELSRESVLPAALPFDEAAAEARATEREELAALDRGLAASAAVEDLAAARWLPTIGVQVEYGVQGNTYRFGSDDDLLTVNFGLSWNLFHGLQDQARLEQARAESERIALQRRDVESRLRLEIGQAYRALKTGEQALVTANARLDAARSAFERTKVRYELGSASQLEFVDARTRLTSAEINLALTEYDRQLDWVELARATALEALPRRTAGSQGGGS